MSTSKMTPIGFGPWGAADSNNTPFDFNQDGNYVLKKVTVQFGEVIDSLTFGYEYNGKTESVHFGGTGGDAADPIDVGSPTNYLLKIKGTYGAYRGKVVITSLSLVTTIGTFGPYGQPRTNDTHFEMPTQGGKIVGFFGNYSAYVAAIGAYMVCTTASPLE